MRKMLVLGVFLCAASSLEVRVDGVTHVLAMPAEAADGIASTPLAVAQHFCASHSIVAERCASSLAEQLGALHYCGSAEVAERKRRDGGVRTFRFVTHAYQQGDPGGELKLLRRVLLENGLVECPMALDFTGDEDVLWVLGHISDPRFFARLEPHQRLNTLPASTDVGSKRNMQSHLVALAGRVGDAALRFVPRTWLPRERNAARATLPLMRGAWVVKDPNVELGGGVRIVNSWGAAQQCEECAVQRYVADPMLLGGKKFSFGVYVTVVSLDPLSVWVHDGEMLVLLSSVDYAEGGFGRGGGASAGASVGTDAAAKEGGAAAPPSEAPRGAAERLEGRALLAHMTNGLLNKRLNPAFDDSECVWNASRLTEYLSEVHGVEWGTVRRQVHRIVATTMVATYESLVSSLHRAAPASTHAGLFTHWRFDFLLDSTLKTWLLECEIVPSAGTIGGPDGPIKLSVMRDMVRLNGLDQPRGGGGDSTAAARSAEAEAIEAIRMTLRAAGDALWVRDDALALIRRHQRHERARGAYTSVIPFAAGVRGMTDASTVIGAFYNEIALPSDLVLRRWRKAEVKVASIASAAAAAQRERRRTGAAPPPHSLHGGISPGDDISPGGAAVIARARATAARAQMKARVRDHGTGGAAMNVARARSACAACVNGAFADTQFCTTVTGFFSGAPGALPEPRLDARCIGRRSRCIDALSEHVDGVGIVAASRCALDEREVRRIVGASHIGSVVEHAAAARAWRGDA